MESSCSVVLFDVNETLSDMAPMADRFREVGVPGHLAPLWFAGVLRDGFALTAAGDSGRFAEIAANALRALLPPAHPREQLDAAVDHVMQGLSQLRPHPDVPDAVRALAAGGHRLATLSNGSTSIAEALFATAGIRDAFEALLTVEDASAWKPARAAYEHAARALAVDPAAMLLVAVHPWDVHGGAKAGLATAWLNRSGATYPSHFVAPDLVLGDLTELPGRLADRQWRGAPGA